MLNLINSFLTCFLLFGLKYFPNFILFLRWRPLYFCILNYIPQWNFVVSKFLVYFFKQLKNLVFLKLTLSLNLLFILLTIVILLSYVHTTNLNPKHFIKPSYLKLSTHLAKILANFGTSCGKVNLQLKYPRLLNLVTIFFCKWEPCF